jgi:hypothetical protein
LEHDLRNLSDLLQVTKWEKQNYCLQIEDEEIQKQIDKLEATKRLIALKTKAEPQERTFNLMILLKWIFV